jgi:hypothetical protein
MKSWFGLSGGRGLEQLLGVDVVVRVLSMQLHCWGFAKLGRVVRVCGLHDGAHGGLTWGDRNWESYGW